MNYYILAVVLATLVYAEVLQKPAFLHTCSVDVPDLRACVIQKAKETLPGLLKGDRKYKLPSFLPLKLKDITVDAGNIVFKLMDAEIYGLDTAELVDVNLNLKDMRTQASIRIKEIRANGTYDVNGQIMVLPIKGHGPGYLHFDGLEIALVFDYYLERKNGYNFMTLLNASVDYTVKNAEFNFESLFNGEKTLGDQMNKFLNENWKDFHEDLKPAIRNMIKSVWLEMHRATAGYIPMEIMFPGWTSPS